MTITLTIEELKAHESALNSWVGNRSQYAAKWLYDNADSMISFGGKVEQYNLALKKWDSGNPPPRLLPAE